MSYSQTTHDTQADTATSLAGPARTKVRQGRQKAVGIDLPNGLGALDARERKAVLSMEGKEVAAGLGARILREMLAKSGKSMRQIATESGFDVSVLSNIARAKHVSGPELWTLVALASAMGFDLDLTFAPR